MNEGLRGPLFKHGFSISFDRRRDEKDRIYVGCIVTHRLGHSRRAEIDLPLDTSGSKSGAQGEGSTVSYGQRYSSKMLLNWVSEGSDDNDGNRPGPTISEARNNDLRDLIKEAKADETRFLKAYGINNLSDLPANKFDHAVAQLRRKIADNA